MNGTIVHNFINPVGNQFIITIPFQLYKINTPLHLSNKIDNHPFHLSNKTFSFIGLRISAKKF